MRKLLLSTSIGLSLGCLVLGMAFCIYSLANPGWLLAEPARAEATLPPATQVVVVSPVIPAPTAAPPEPTPSLPPLPTAVDAPCGGPQQITLALLGVDDRSGGYVRAPRTDAISLVNVRFISRTASLLSVPRDLYVPLPNLSQAGISQDRLNTAYLYGEIYDVPGGGPAELKDTIRWNFGVPVDRYVMINFGAFEAAVDALGGIDVDVPKAIYDPLYPAEEGFGTIIFELPGGLQHLDGKTALRYARTRHQDDDYHRIQRQQLVMLAIRDKLFSPQIIPQIPALLGTMNGLVKTDLAPEEIAALACIGPLIDRSAISAHVIDGTMVIPWVTPTGGHVSVPNREAIAPVISEFLGK